jgi:kumamolisin
MTKTRLLVLALFLSAQTWGAAALLAAPQDERTPEQETLQTEERTATDEAAQSVAFKPQGMVITPESSVFRPEDAGVRAHTNYLIFVPAGREVSSPNPDFTFTETPASLGCVYKVGPIYAGCNPSAGGTNQPTGGWGAIALVDAYDNPDAAADLASFSTRFGLPAASFTKVYANQAFDPAASCSGTPPGDTGWGLEEDLDIQWARSEERR